MIFADLELARRLEISEASGIANYPRAQMLLDPSSGGAVEQIGSGYAVFVSLDSPLSRAVGLGLYEPLAEDELSRVEDFYLSRGAHVVIDVCPLADSSFVKLLGRRGYRLAEFQHIWFRSLDEDERPRVHSDELEVREIGPDEADVWIRTVTRGFAGHDEVTGKEMSIAAMTFRIPANRCFLARLEGEPVGGGVLSVNDGCAALFSGSTLAAARRRGVQTALIGARLDAAIAAGCELASVKTSPGNDSQRNVERAGFRLAYTRAALILERTDAA